MPAFSPAKLQGVRSRNVLGLCLGLLLIAGSGLISLHSIHASRTHTAWLARSIEIIKTSGVVQTLLSGIVVDSRGYLLTQQVADRQDLLAQRERLTIELERVRGLVLNNPEQQARWADISAVVTARAQIAETVAQHVDSGSRAIAEDMLTSGLGNELSTQFVGQMEAFIEAEEQHRARRQAQLSRDLWQSFAFTGGTTLGGMILVVAAAWLVLRENRRRRTAEHAALELAEMARTTLSSIGDGVITTDAQGRITQLNPVAEVLTGWTHAQAHGRPVAEVFRIVDEHSHDPEPCPAAHVLREGTNIGLANHTLLVRRDGTEIPIADSGAPIIGPSGITLGVVLVFRDQSVEREAEHALRDRERQLRIALQANKRIMRHSLDVICTVDEDGKFVDVSPACERVWGYPPEQLCGRSYMEMVTPEDQAKTKAAAETIISGQPAFDFENRYLHRTGEPIPMRWSAVWSAEDRLMFCVARDITDQKRSEEALNAALATAEEANRAKSRFIANMSHELRTPLNAIIGFSEMLEGHIVGDLNAKQDRYVSNVLSSGRHLLNLINDILDLAKVESGKLVLLPEEFDPATAIDDALNTLRGLADQKGIALETTRQPDLPRLFADPSKFKQVLYNLLSNAIKFTPADGRVQVRVSAVRLADRRIEGLRIEVQDSGIGIKPEMQARVWQEFEQIDSTYARTQQGTGLGLTLTKRLVELHDGRIWVESTGIEGQGSIFAFEIPLRQLGGVSRPTATITPFPFPTTPNNDRSDQRPLVLVVEDDDIAHDLLESHLKNGGYDVARAHTAAEAREFARELQPAAITLDILLPDRPGWEVLSDLKADARTRDIPVVVVSVTDDKQLGFSLGAVEFLVKPVQRDNLLDTIRRHTPPGLRQACHVLIMDDEPEAIEPLALAIRAAGHEVEIAESGAAGLAKIARHRPDVLILDLLMPEMNGFEVVDRLRADPITAHLPILIHTSKDLTAEELAQLGQRVQGISAKPQYDRLLANLCRLCAPSVQPRSDS